MKTVDSSGSCLLHRFSRNIVALMMMLLVAGCCTENSPAVQQQKKAEQALQAAAAAVIAPDATASAEPMAKFFDVQLKGFPANGVAVKVLNESCIDGRGRNASVNVDWQLTDPAIQRVRASIIENGKPKTWVENGPVWSEATGPWMQDGMSIRLQSLPGEQVVGELKILSKACGGAQ